MNTIQEIAYKVRQHYYEGFIDEYHKQKNKILQLSNGDQSVQSQYRIQTDCELTPFKKDIKLTDIINNSNQTSKLYRDDIVIFENNKPAKEILFYPVHDYEEDDYVEEDMPDFKPFIGKVKQTEIEVHPFPWFCTKITFYNNAEPIKGILDFWFYMWFFKITKPSPFLNVVHRMDGPQLELYGGESYYIDLGTAPPEAFIDLIFQISRIGVDKIEIN